MPMKQHTSRSRPGQRYAASNPATDSGFPRWDGTPSAYMREGNGPTTHRAGDGAYVGSHAPTLVPRIIGQQHGQPPCPGDRPSKVATLIAQSTSADVGLADVADQLARSGTLGFEFACFLSYRLVRYIGQLLVGVLAALIPYRDLLEAPTAVVRVHGAFQDQGNLAFHLLDVE